MIYCVEDDAGIRELVVYTLQNTGMEARGFSDGAALTAALRGAKPDLILLDIMLPGEDGISILRRLRSLPDTAAIPVILLTAKNTEYDKVIGLDSGADDYIAKPFSPGVLVAKVKAQLAQYDRLKGTKKETKRITLGDIMLEPDTRRVWVDGKEKELPNKEFQLLEFLMEHPDVVFSRESLYTRIWGLDSLGNTSTVPVHINRLRETVEKDPANPRHIITIWGVGYKFKP